MQEVGCWRTHDDHFIGPRVPFLPRMNRTPYLPEKTNLARKWYEVFNPSAATAQRSGNWYNVDFRGKEVKSVDGTTRKEFEEALMWAMFGDGYGNGRVYWKVPSCGSDYHSWTKIEDGDGKIVGQRSYYFEGYGDTTWVL